MKSLIPYIVTGLTLISLTGCAPDRVDRFGDGAPYESFGVVSEKEVFPDNELRSLGLKKTSVNGEVFVDDHYVWLVDIPEMPNTARAINSPRLYNSVDIGDTVNLVLRDSEHWIEDTKGNRLSKPRSTTLVLDYSPRKNREEVEK